MHIASPLVGAESPTKVDRLKELQVATVAELDALLSSILYRAFKGGEVVNKPSDQR